MATSLVRPTDKMVASSAQIKFRGASHAIDATPARRRGGSGSSLLDEHLTHWLICAQVASRNGKHAFSPRAKNFDCGGCELALLGLTMCPMRSEPPYDFPRGVTAAIFHQTVRFKTIFWARTNVVKMSFASPSVSRHLRVKGRGDGVESLRLASVESAAQRPCPHRRSNGSKNRTKAFAKERTSCNAFARSLGYKISQLQALDALYEQRRKVDPALVLKVRYESMQLDEAGTLATVARFLGVERRGGS